MIDDYKIYPLGLYALTPEDYAVMKGLTEEGEVSYTHVLNGDSGEKGEADVFRMRHPDIPGTKLQECVDYLFCDRFHDFLLRELGINGYELDRIQTQIYKEGYFLGQHVDRDSSDYDFTLVFIMKQALEGGEFVMLIDDREISVSPEEGSLIILDSHIPHEVKRVIKGSRRTMCAFLKVKKARMLAG